MANQYTDYNLIAPRFYIGSLPKNQYGFSGFNFSSTPDLSEESQDVFFNSFFCLLPLNNGEMPEWLSGAIDLLLPIFYFPTYDNCYAGHAWLDAIIAAIASQTIGNNKDTLVFCRAGISRLALVATAYIMRLNYWPAERALKYVAERRPCIDPCKTYVDALKDYYQHIVKTQEPPI